MPYTVTLYMYTSRLPQTAEDSIFVTDLIKFFLQTPLQKAQKYKNEGNVHFKTGKYDEAIARYNEAIDICPKENVEDLATFYQNRAAAYEQLVIEFFSLFDCPNQ